MTMPSIKQTIEFIKIAHAGQTDGLGKPYFHHPIRVMRKLPRHADLELKLAALLHDVIEDTPYTREDLLAMGYTARTLDAVELVSYKETRELAYEEKLKAYADWVDNIIASGNVDAILLKKADMEENTDHKRLKALPRDKRLHFIRKYRRPLQRLRAAERDLRRRGLIPARPSPAHGRSASAPNPALRAG